MCPVMDQNPLRRYLSLMSRQPKPKLVRLFWVLKHLFFKVELIPWSFLCVTQHGRRAHLVANGFGATPFQKNLFDAAGTRDPKTL